MGTAVRKAVCIAATSAVASTCCATPGTLEPNGVEPTQCTTLDCDPLNAEAQRVQSRHAESSGGLERAAGMKRPLESLASMTDFYPAVALLLIPLIPALNNGKEEDERRVEECDRLSSQREATLRAAARNGCPGATPAENRAATSCGSRSRIDPDMGLSETGQGNGAGAAGQGSHVARRRGATCDARISSLP